MEYTASRLSEGNKLFPARITITPQGVTLKVPGFLGGKEQTMPFNLISSVDLETPFVGFSTIKLYSSGWYVIVATGFSKADVIAIKEEILSGQSNLNNPSKRASGNYSSNDNSPQSDSSGGNSESGNWDEKLRELQELLDDDVISVEEFEQQKLNVFRNVSLDGNLKLSDGLRQLNDLQEEDIITEGEFNILKQKLLNNTPIPKPLISSLENVKPQATNSAAPQAILNVSSENGKPQTNNLEPMYNDQINKLIEFALADGELTEKEKQILFKKAEASGIDLDEFEMVLDAKLFEKQQSNKKVEIPLAAPKSDRYGDVRKCPACGAMISSFSAKCTDCGHEFSNIEANASIQKLFKMLNDVEDQRKDDSGIFGELVAKSFGGTNKIIEKKKSIISGFPIPNTRDDILEFLSTAIPNARKKGNFFSSEQPENKSHNELAPTWNSKCEQIIMKARFSLKEDKKTLEEINNYAKELGIK